MSFSRFHFAVWPDWPIFRTLLHKVFVALCILAALGLPITTPGKFLVLAVLLLVLVASRNRLGTGAWRWPALLAILAVVVRLVAPLPVIQEGHNMYLPGMESAVLADMPDEVQQSLLKGFVEHHPPHLWCNPKIRGCWQAYGKPDSLFAWSSESFWRKALYSRVAHAFFYRDLGSLKASFVNEKKWNWYAWSSDLSRQEMPWYVMLEWSKHSQGGQFCSQGVVFEQRGNQLQRLPEKQCQIVSADWQSQGVRHWAVAPSSYDLALSYQPAFPQQILLLFMQLFSMAMAGLCIAFSQRPNWRRLVPAVLTTGAAAAVIWWIRPYFWDTMPIFQGGNDGLTHSGYGNVIAENLFRGDWRGALQGFESVYFFMPGLRYLRAVERLLFGEMPYLYLMAVMLLPWAIYVLLRQVVAPLLAVCLLVMFLIGPLSETGLSYRVFVIGAHAGFGMSMASLMFVIGLLALFAHTHITDSRFLAGLGSLSLAIACWLRPNVLPAAGILVLLAAWPCLKQRDWLRFGAIVAGFSVTGGMLLHNLAFGHQFVLFTSAADSSANLGLSPHDYLAALSGDASALTHIGRHFAKWEISIVSLILMVSLLPALFVSKARNPMLRPMALAALLMLVVFLFYMPRSRYLIMPGLFSWMVLAGLVQMLYTHVSQRWPWRGYRIPEPVTQESTA
ncbi:MAG: hypothetical protein U9N14_07180 [Pseudomonadota bacterium]|nr:hypothetical protein [Pseudomonadota bacterium]